MKVNQLMTQTTIRGTNSQHNDGDQSKLGHVSQYHTRATEEIEVISSVSSVAELSGDVFALMAELDRYTKLGADWDGDSAAPISNATIYSTMRLLSKFSFMVRTYGLNWYTPDMSPIPDGSITLYWNLNSRWLQLRVLPNLEEYQLISGAPNREPRKSNATEIAALEVIAELLGVT